MRLVSLCVLAMILALFALAPAPAQIGGGGKDGKQYSSVGITSLKDGDNFAVGTDVYITANVTVNWGSAYTYLVVQATAPAGNTYYYGDVSALIYSPGGVAVFGGTGPLPAGTYRVYVYGGTETWESEALEFTIGG